MAETGLTSALLVVLAGAARFAEGVDHAGVGQGGGVAQLAAGGDVARQAAHDLAGAGLRQVGGERPAVVAERGSQRRNMATLDTRNAWLTGPWLDDREAELGCILEKPVVKSMELDRADPTCRG